MSSSMIKAYSKLGSYVAFMQNNNGWPHIIFLSFFLTFFFVMEGHSQPPFQNPINLNQKNGLPNNLVHDVVQDQQGFIWIATSNGLCRYDGSQIKIYDYVANDTSHLYTRSVRNLMVDRLTGEIFLSTGLGLHIYNPVKDSFKSFLPIDGDTSQLANNSVTYTYQDREGKIWISSFTHGLALYQRESDNFQQFFPSRIAGVEEESEAALYNQVNTFIQDYRLDHVYWMVTKKGLTRWDREEGKIEIIPLPGDGRIGFEKLIGAKAIHQHSDGTIIIGLWAYGFITYHPASGKWKAIETVVDTDGAMIDIRTIAEILPKDSHCVYVSNSWNQLFVYDLKLEKNYQNLEGKS